MEAVEVNEYERALADNLTRYYTSLGLSDIPARIAERRSRRRGKLVVQALDERLPPGRYRILDVGCGWGEMLLELVEWRSAGEVWGVEPDPELCRLSAQINGNVKEAGAEKLPFEDGAFDLVVLNDVIEHVRDQRRSLREIIRVLKPGGRLYYSFPNYAYPFEGHYKIPFLPFSNRLPRALGSAYLRMRGRDPEFWQKYLSPLSDRQFYRWLDQAASAAGRSVRRDEFSMFIGGAARRRIFGPQSVRGLATIA